jgi:uncharacterized glyoxalase superfamily protein PhnB
MADCKPVPEGFHRVTPHIVVGDANKAIEFYKKAFGAEEICRMPSPDGSKIMHAEIKIGDSVVMLCDDFPEMCGGQSRDPKKIGASPVTLHQYVNDVDNVMKQAESAGATVTMPATDMFWGDRYGKLTCPFGHDWGMATHVKDMTPEEMQQASAQAFS